MKNSRKKENFFKTKVLFISLYDISACPIRTIHSFLKRENYSVSILFFKELLFNQMEEPTKKELDLLISTIKLIGPDFICLSVKSPLLSIAGEISNLIKKEVDKPIIWGGSHATIVPEECIEYADIVCVGEGEYALLEFLQNPEKTNIDNLWIKKGNEIIKNPVRNLVEDLDSLPFFDYSNENKYTINHDKISKGDPIIKKSNLNMIIGRGCFHNCTFCCNAYFLKLNKGKGKVVRKKSVGRVIEELLDIKKNLRNLKEIYFSDEVFSVSKEWITEFSKEYKKINIPFCCSFHPDNIDEEVVSMLKSAGLVYIQMGIQSGSQKIREEVYRRFTPNDLILKAAGIMKKYKIIPKYDIILDNVYETEKDKEESFEFLLKLPRPYDLSLYSLTNFPKTELTERLIRDKYIKREDSKKALKQWRMTFSVKREKSNIHYNCMVSLLSKSFVPKSLIRTLFKSDYLKRNPYILVFFVKVCNHIKLARAGIRMILTGRMSFSRLIYHLKNYKGITI